jgi:hypothetical protein
MPAISALDALGPAIERTKTFLFKPFRLSTFLKLCLVAVLTEGFGSNFNFSVPSGPSSHQSHFTHAPFQFTPEILAAIIAGGLLLLVLSFLLFYLVTRLRFAYFHCLVQNTRQIRPGWRLYRPQAIRFFWFNVLVGICFLVFAVLLAAPFVAGFWGLFHHLPPGGHPNLAALFSLLILVLPVVLLLALAGLSTDLILRDFMLPHYALENATASQAWAATWARIRAEKMPFFVYALLRLLLPVAAMIGIFVILIIPVLVFGVAFVAIGIGIHTALATATGGMAILRIALEVFIGLLAFGIATVAGICLAGPVGTALRQYALVFYGARYEKLGALLFPQPDAPQDSPGNA